jgi:hypothetical protein
VVLVILREEEEGREGGMGEGYSRMRDRENESIERGLGWGMKAKQRSKR